MGDVTLLPKIIEYLIATIIDTTFNFGYFSIRCRIMWALSGFSLSNVSRKLSNLSNPSTATSSVYSNGGMGAYRDGLNHCSQVA